MLYVLGLMMCLCGGPHVSLAAIHDGGSSPPIRIEESVVEEIAFNSRPFTIRENLTVCNTFPDLILPQDPNIFSGLERIGETKRYTQIGWNPYYGFLYEATYKNGKTIEIIVEKQANVTIANALALSYANHIGKLPPFLLSGVVSLHLFIQDGYGPSGRFPEYYNALADNTSECIEEMFIHKFVHASLDFPIPWVYYDPRDKVTVVEQIGIVEEKAWMTAIAKDNFFISDYARERPKNEDLAEVFPAYLASRWRPERFDPLLIDFLNEKFYHRFKVLDDLELFLP
jgi:hypothetical protein